MWASLLSSVDSYRGTQDILVYTCMNKKTHERARFGQISEKERILTCLGVKIHNVVLINFPTNYCKEAACQEKNT